MKPWTEIETGQHVPASKRNEQTPRPAVHQRLSDLHVQRGADGAAHADELDVSRLERAPGHIDQRLERAAVLEGRRVAIVVGSTAGGFLRRDVDVWVSHARVYRVDVISKSRSEGEEKATKEVSRVKDTVGPWTSRLKGRLAPWRVRPRPFFIKPGAIRILSSVNNVIELRGS